MIGHSMFIFFDFDSDPDFDLDDTPAAYRDVKSTAIKMGKLHGKRTAALGGRAQ